MVSMVPTYSPHQVIRSRTDRRVARRTASAAPADTTSAANERIASNGIHNNGLVRSMQQVS